MLLKQSVIHALDENKPPQERAWHLLSNHGGQCVWIASTIGWQARPAWNKIDAPARHLFSFLFHSTPFFFFSTWQGTACQGDPIPRVDLEYDRVCAFAGGACICKCIIHCIWLSSNDLRQDAACSVRNNSASRPMDSQCFETVSLYISLLISLSLLLSPFIYIYIWIHAVTSWYLSSIAHCILIYKKYL